MNNSYQIDTTRWNNLTIFEQMGNIGSEVGRSIKARRAGDVTAWENALARALHLFDCTVETLIAKKSVRVREVLRARDQYLELFYGDSSEEAAAAGLEQYFMQFAIAARIHR